MLKPLEQWFCDVCGEVVDKGNGYVVWKSEQGIESDFRIIHQGKCDIDKTEYYCSNPITKFLGRDGVNYFCTFLSRGPFQGHFGEGDRARITNFYEFTEFIRRCQIPYYEEARTKFDDENVVRLVDGGNGHWEYLPDTLLQMICAAKAS